MCVLRGQIIALSVVFAAGSAVAAGGPACISKKDAPTADNIPVPGEHTVVIHEPAFFKDHGADFSLGKTLGAIISSAQGSSANTPDARIALLKSLLASLSQPSFKSPDGIVHPVTPRPVEAALDPKKLLDPNDSTDGMRVAGLFNRLDLAPNNFAYCGEHRIVYEKGGADPSAHPLNRFTLIFEAAVTNPDAHQRPEGCLEIAKLWAGLTGKNDKDQAEDLEKLYYHGLDQTPPVVNFRHYGLPFGQVRANMFVNDSQNPLFLWQLRQWQTFLNSNGGVEFKPAQLGENPEQVLYQDSSPGEDPTLASFRQSFQNDFVANSASAKSYISQLLNSDDRAASGVATNEDDFFFGLGINVDSRYDSYQSTSNSHGTQPADDPNLLASTGLKAAIDTTLKDTNATIVPSDCRPSVQQVLARAGTQACGGCHEFSAPNNQGQSLGPSPQDLKWLGSLEFVQIDEAGNLSPLLNQRFVPERISNLKRFIADHPVLPAAAAAFAVRPTTLAERVDSLNAQITIPRARSLSSTEARAAEASIEALRREDRATPGAFMAFRPAD
jgi:hypothetical protein